MRTTITLTPEAEALVKRAKRERNLSFEEVFNPAIVTSLTRGPREPIVLPTRDYGRSFVNLDEATQLAGELEDEEIVRKMSMGK